VSHVTSRDGTQIGFDETGRGPALIRTGGAFQDRSALAAHAALLSSHFTVFNYDRRGRGESGDNPPYAVEREIEDIGALIHAAGGSALLFGGSSGAVLALDAAAHGLAIPKLALYEPPFVVDDTRNPVPEAFVDQLKEMIVSGRRGDAAEAFMTQGANVPAEVVAQMRHAPVWPATEAAAHTLIYDATIMDGTMSGKPLPAPRWASVSMPTLVMDGGNSPVWARHTVQALVSILLNAQRRTLPAQEHGVTAEALAPVLEEFFNTEA
jgi:pimeloyl-ACP methyl ester carboxylesterase